LFSQVSRHFIVSRGLGRAKWRTVSWRTGTKGKLKARFAAVRVRVADGPPQRIRDTGQQHLPGDEAWLIGEHRMTGEKKYYLANLPAKADLRTLATATRFHSRSHPHLFSVPPAASCLL
jgi:SRSO17 transposase